MSEKIKQSSLKFFSHLVITSVGYIFCHAVGEALATIPDKRNICSYSDDNLVFTKDFKTFMHALEIFLSALKEFGFCVNPKKCDFRSTSADFLGPVVTYEWFGHDE